MNKDLFISGSIVVTRDENQKVKFIQFVPDDEFTPVLEQSSKTSGQLQLLRNAAFDYVANKPRVRSNSLLIRKVKHGRLSGTRDHAFQLTLKVFASEGIDWQKAFVWVARRIWRICITHLPCSDSSPWQVTCSLSSSASRARMISW